MLNNSQLIFVIRSIFPVIKEADHGAMYWVGMPVDGATQVGPAFIVEWGFIDIEQPTEQEILAEWAKPDVKAAYEAASKPAPITTFSVREFRARFTLDEQRTIRQAQLTDMDVGLVYDDFQSAQFIDIGDPAVAAGVDLFISKGLIEPSRRAALLSAEQPESVGS